jgi:hypothetical protein
MASDIQLNENTVVVDGNVGVGTSTPVRKLHVEGSEIHSGGADCGFSFADRTQGNGERWLWYAQDGKAHLWSQKQGKNIFSLTAGGEVRDLTLTNIPTLQVGTVDGLNLGQTIPVIFKSGISLSAKGIAEWYKFALTTQDDKLLLNQGGAFKNGVKIDGNVQVTGTLTQASSIALKENVSELSGQEALAALQGLQAVKYTYKADAKKEQHLGFIAEDVPDLVASSARDRLSLMDFIAVLTKAVQEQQSTIADLAAEVNTLKQPKRGQ